MVSSNGVGLMAVVAVSGSVALVALQLHKKLLSEFMKKVEFELGGERYRAKKKVKFGEDVLEPSSNSKEYRRRGSKISTEHDWIPATSDVPNGNSCKDLVATMPLNRIALYKGIIEYRMLKCDTV